MTQHPGPATSPEPAVPPAQRVPATEDFPTGPAVGERFPDFTLRDQHHADVTSRRCAPANRALIVFERSARW